MGDLFGLFLPVVLFLRHFLVGQHLLQVVDALLVAAVLRIHFRLSGLVELLQRLAVLLGLLLGRIVVGGTSLFLLVYLLTLLPRHRHFRQRVLRLGCGDLPSFHHPVNTVDEVVSPAGTHVGGIVGHFPDGLDDMVLQIAPCLAHAVEVEGEGTLDKLGQINDGIARTLHDVDDEVKTELDGLERGVEGHPDCLNHNAHSAKFVVELGAV